MMLVSERAENSFQELGMDGSVESLGSLLEAQKKLFHSQVDDLQRLVVTQCKLTGVNPLSQEMAAGALSIKIGKKPWDMLNPKAVKYMQSVFAIKDTIGKKETREISAICGITVTQVREFFSGQRSKVRKLINIAREKAGKSDAANEGCPVNLDETLLCGSDTPSSAVDTKNIQESTELPASNGNFPAIQSCEIVPVSSVDAKPSQVVLPSSSLQEESIPGIDEDDKKFLDNIFNLMRKEETFSGQVKLMEWILQIHNSAVLIWFLTKGGMTILATWLSQAATEEQTTVLIVILKVLCHLPLQKALPVQLSAILQTVNKLRFYRTPDISNRAKVLLSRWSKMLARNHALNSNGVQKDILRKQRINELLSDEFWRTKIGITEDIFALTENIGNGSTSDPKQALKALTVSTENSGRKQGQVASSIKIKERRKVQLVEQLDQKSAGRFALVGRAPPSNHSRPISADDIQKAKMRAMFMQLKHGKADACSSENKKIEENNPLAPQSKKILPVPGITQLSQVNKEKEKVAEALPGCSETPVDTSPVVTAEEELLEKLKRSRFQWQTPAEMKIHSSWMVGEAESSKELVVQAQRIRREKETFYSSKFDIPPNPKEPWDIEIDHDDSLTPEIPIEQLPDVDAVEEPTNPPVDEQTNHEGTPIILPMASSGNATAAPDLELLAVLLKNPELVFALTSGQGKNLTSDERVALLDMIKESSVALSASVNGMNSTSLEKLREPEPMSLPSPTPPSDAERATGWRSAFSTTAKVQLPQSQFSGAAHHSISTLNPIATPIPLTVALPTQTELQSFLLPLSQVITAATAAPHIVAASRLTSQKSTPALSQRIIPSLPQNSNAESALHLKNYTESSPAIAVLPSTPASFPRDSYSQSHHPMPTISSISSLHRHQEKARPPAISGHSVAVLSPNLVSLSRRNGDTERQNMMSEWEDAMPKSSARRTNAAEPYFGATVGSHRDIFPTNQDRSTRREEKSRFRNSEAWSPESSPVRSSEFRHGQSWNHFELREQGWNQRQGWSRQQSCGHRNMHRSNNGRWRDWDRDQGRRR